jgi:NAD(P)-dependent dehydrogenase (short-subunit alcohol dehydrogenase family)
MRVLLTGASSGIGAATARRLAKRGDDVVLVARGREGLDKVAREVEELGGTALVAEADITDREALRGAFDRAVAELGGLDAVIANAGAGAYGLFRDLDPEDVDRTIQVVLIGAANTIREALPHLERSHGTLVATASVAGLYPMPLAAAYSAAKHGLRGLVNSIRIELRATGSDVRIAMVHPGPVDTPFWVNVTPEDFMPPKMPPQIAQDPDEIARQLIRAIEKPRPEQVVGWTMKAVALVPRPLRDLALTQIVRLAIRNAAHDPPGRALWEPSGEGETTQLAKR